MLSNDTDYADRIIILIRTGVKFLRGTIRRIFLKQAKGLFLVGKHVQISHAKHISCGKNVKFEDYADVS